MIVRELLARGRRRGARSRFLQTEHPRERPAPRLPRPEEHRERQETQERRGDFLESLDALHAFPYDEKLREEEDDVADQVER